MQEEATRIGTIGLRATIAGLALAFTTISEAPIAGRASQAVATAVNTPAAGIVVNSLADGAPANDGLCTLREAMLNANADNQSGSTDCAAGAGSDAITFTATGTINLTGALPVISTNVQILGPGANALNVHRSTGGDYLIFRVEFGQTVTIAFLTVSNGKGTAGGGIANFGTLTLASAAIIGNQANTGGGIYALRAVSTITDTTISGNVANNGAGGMVSESATTSLTNCTISGNTALFVGAGGITNVVTFQPALMTVTNCTITDNKGPSSGAIYTFSDSQFAATTTIRNTIAAGNLGPNFLKIGPLASVVSPGNNLTDDGGGGVLNAPGDRINTDPRLLPLGDYGGATRTHALAAGSPAIDAGNDGAAPANDQRGFARGVNGRGIGAAHVDIGAYEVRSKFINVATGNDANNGSTLALPFKTIAHGIAAAATGDDLIIAAGTYPENNLVVAKSINFQGASMATTTVNGGFAGRVFAIDSGATVAISNLAVANGRAGTGAGGGITNGGTLTLASCGIFGNATDGFGGGIDSYGRLDISDCLIAGNQAAVNGGGIHNAGVLTVSRTTISANTGFDGGALFNYQPGVATLTNSTISGNTATTFTGGITNINFGGETPAVSAINCTVSGNTGPTEGGIATVDEGGAVVTTLKNTIVATNSTPNLAQLGMGASVVSQGNNLTSDSGNGLLTGPGDLINSNPMLAVLANNGGPTITQLPQVGSPAVDAGSATGAPARDQRGVRRPLGAAGDIGAAEVSSGACAASFIAPGVVPPGALGSFYDRQLSATGGTGPYVFSVATGSALPAGLGLSSGGALSGTPTTGGAHTFSLSVLSQTGCLSTQNFAMNVAAGGCDTGSATPITVGQTLRGQITPGDCTTLIFGDDSPSDYYVVDGAAGQQLSIAMSSTDVDSWLTLVPPSATYVHDDNGGGGVNARIPEGSGFYTLTETGTHYILAFAYPGQSGNYTLTLGGQFTDAPLTATTVVKAVHLAESRARINALRQRFGLAAAVWTDPAPAGVAIKAVHVTQMRAALAEAYSQANATPPTYTNAVAVGLLVKAIDTTELRNAITALEALPY